MTITVTLTEAQRTTIKEFAAWTQTSDSITEAESAVLDHLLAVPAPISIPEGRKMKEFHLDVRGCAPVTFCGVNLTSHEIIGTHVATSIHVFRTKAGEYLLYVGNVGSQNTLALVGKLYRHADAMTSQEVISACNGGRGNNAAADAKKALEALGLNTVERIA